jgi:hypothetical protein
MMAHLLDALAAELDIGHYGRLVVAIVGRHFLEQAEFVHLVRSNLSEMEARSLWLQVTEHDYSPPGPDTIHRWQLRQSFPICPDPRDPDACNVYKQLDFPDRVYAHIADYYEEKAARSPSL